VYSIVQLLWFSCLLSFFLFFFLSECYDFSPDPNIIPVCLPDWCELCLQSFEEGAVQCMPRKYKKNVKRGAIWRFRLKRAINESAECWRRYLQLLAPCNYKLYFYTYLLTYLLTTADTADRSDRSTSVNTIVRGTCLTLGWCAVKAWNNLQQNSTASVSLSIKAPFSPILWVWEACREIRIKCSPFNTFSDNI